MGLRLLRLDRCPHTDHGDAHSGRRKQKSRREGIGRSARTIEQRGAGDRRERVFVAARPRAR